MASLNTSTNGPSIKSSYLSIVNSPPPSGPAANSPTYGVWSIFTVSAPLVNAFQADAGGKESVLKVQATGEGELIDLIEDLSEGRIQFAFVKVKDPNTALPKFVLIGWCGEGVPERTKGYFTSHLAAVSKILHGYHVQITARSDRDLTPENIVQKVADASGAKYSAASDSVSQPPKPPTASKPAFNPTRSAGGSGFNPLAGRSRPGYAEKDVDADGWGADAPQVSRSQLEKVQSAYKPTKVNMAELTKQHQPSSYQPRTAPESNPDVVKGGYQPIGKVDIAALRAQAKSTDDRPTTVKGAYEPVGKVDIAAIRARAQKPTDNGDSQAASQANTADDASRSLADRSAAFSQSERITTMPKPKVGNKFGASAGSFGGTKAPTPGGYGQAAPTTAPAPVGAASRTFADEGGKTPAQIWAEKKARERGQSGAADTAVPATAAPIKSQPSGTGEWKSGYTGKSWAPVATTHTGHSGSGGNLEPQGTGEQTQEPDAPTSPSGGIAALKDRFVGGAPMGAPATAAPAREASPPPLPSSSRPAGGIAMPGLPTRGRPDADESSSSGPNIPAPPPVQRSPTPSPERESSPVRVAMPVARGREASIEAPAERHDVPALPVSSMVQKLPAAKDEEPTPAGRDAARVAGVAVAAATFGAAAAIATTQHSEQGGKRAVILYDYEKAEDNEVELVEGEFVSNIDMVDEDWWMGTNARGESGLFPSNYVELVEDGEPTESRAPPPHPAPTAAAVPAPAEAAAPESADEGVRATAQFDYEAAEDNELSFPEGAIIEQVEFPDEDWWFGHYQGQAGLFPANYVELIE